MTDPAAQPVKKERPKPKPIEGLSLLDPTKLAADFRRFRHDDLYFISTCLFHPPGGKPVPRIIAMTPVAMFVTDANGKMDRASRFEAISEATEQSVTIKKLFGSENRRNILLRVPKEIDCQVSFDMTIPAEAESAANCLQILKKIVEDKTKKPFPINEMEQGKDIAALRNDSAAAGYLSPQEILKQNKDRQLLAEQLDGCTSEVLDLKRQILESKKQVEDKSKELKLLESSVGVDLSVLRKQKQQLQHRQVMIHKKLTMDEIELVKQQADCTRLREQLDEERQNYEKLVKQKLSSAGNNASQQQNEMMQLRQKAQQREIAKATSKLTTAKEVLAVFPSYSGPDALVLTAIDLEKRVAESVEKWERDMETSNKIDKFLDALNAEVSRISYYLGEKNQQKQAVLREREQQRAKLVKPAAAPAATSVASASRGPAMIDLMDDDLLGDGAMVRRVNSDSNMAEAPRSIRQEDHDDAFGDAITGAGGGAAKSAPSGGAGDLDDLLDGPAPAAKTAAVEDDLF